MLNARPCVSGMSGEGASLAAHWGLGKLIVFYDDNHISIDGHTDISFTEDVKARYDAYGWHTQHVEAGAYTRLLLSSTLALFMA